MPAAPGGAEIADSIKRLVGVQALLGIAISAIAIEPGKQSTSWLASGMTQIAGPAFTPSRQYFGTSRIDQAVSSRIA